MHDESHDRPDSGGGASRVRAVARAIDILMAFSHQQPDLSLGEIADRTGLSKPTAFRILATLRQGDLISQRADTGAYRLGAGISALAAIRLRQSGLLDLAMPVMRAVRDAVNETVSLATRVGDSRVQIYQVESLHAVRRGTQAGERTPLYAGASNKLLLAFMDDPEIAEYLARTPLVAFTPRTVTDPAELWRQLHQIRADGYAESLGEKYIGGTSVAAPVRDPMGTVVATIYVSVPEQRYTAELRRRCIDALLAGAAEISGELGYRP